MKFYLLHISPGEIEGEDCDEYFTSLEAAKQRRAALMENNLEEDLEGEFQIDRITLVDLPPMQLALALLNRKAFICKREVVVDAVAPSPMEDARD
jgi:hypothetical protein